MVCWVSVSRRPSGLACLFLGWLSNFLDSVGCRLKLSPVHGSSDVYFGATKTNTSFVGNSFPTYHCFPSFLPFSRFSSLRFMHYFCDLSCLTMLFLFLGFLASLCLLACPPCLLTCQLDCLRACLLALCAYVCFLRFCLTSFLTSFLSSVFA